MTRKIGSRLTAAAVAVMVASSLATGACSAGDASGEPSVSAAQDNLYFNEPGRWGATVHVCWGNAIGATQKTWLQQALKGQRSWEQFGDVTLVGWDVCASTTTPGIHVLSDPGKAFANSLGEPASGVVEVHLDFSASATTTWLQCTDNGLNLENCVKAVALHEFGHALGSAHEQNRPTGVPASCLPCATDAACNTGNGEYCEDGHCNQGDNGTIGFGGYDAQSIMNYCASPNPTDLSPLDRQGFRFFYEPRSGDSQRMGDANGDGYSDIICHDTVTGDKWVDYASTSGQFLGTDWARSGGWCNNSTNRLFKGDFNGDGRIDLLCHDLVSGTTWLDYASSTGQYGGTDFQTSSNFCLAGNKLLIGDFNGDGRDDMFCRDTVRVTDYIDFADSSGHFGTTADTTFLAAACAFNDHGQLYVGNFNGDAFDDILCAQANGFKSVSFGTTTGLGGGWSTTNTWCAHDTGEILIGDFNGDSRDDLLCHDVASGTEWIDYADASGQFQGTNWQRSANFCSGAGNRLFVGDFNNDNHDDILCHSIANGTKTIDFASSSGQFLGADWTLASGWCGHSAGELH